MENHLNHLKNRLQSLGALRHSAWEDVQSYMRTTDIKTHESFVREEGTLAFVSRGILKEYAARNRKKPAIINFICDGQAILTNGYNRDHYLKACTECKILHWSFENILKLHNSYPELKNIYDQLSIEYETSIAFRSLLFEQRLATTKIHLFIQQFRRILPHLKKKDMANYLHLDYDHFVRNYQKLLSYLPTTMIFLI